MSLTTAAIQVLVAKGLSAQDILEVSLALDVRKDSTAAERQRRCRERKAVTRDMSQRDVTRDPPPNDIYSNPPPPPEDCSNEQSPPTLFENEIETADLKPEHVVEAWNEMAGRCGLSKAKLTPERRRKLAGRIKSQSVEDWTEAIAAVERSRFCRGENDKGWRAGLDFLLQPSSFTKLIEGSYDQPH